SFLGVNPALADPNVEIDPKTMEKEHIAIVEDEPLILVLQSFTDTVEKANFLYAKSNEHLGCLVISLLPNTPLSDFDRDLFVKKYLAEKSTYVTELKHKIEEALSHAQEYGSREATYDKKVEDIIFGKQEQEGDR
ncbi:hypothetical protein, partial [Hydrotalea sp.]|uniref:hypothetical protein n=1 Tax=Hydrotalea sp. TaxID=2881279 RepID=UPI003D0D930E